MSKSESQISINEHLSALLDDEAGSFEERRVLDELKSDQHLSAKLSSYALIGETMRMGDTEKPVISVGSDFLEGIHNEIAKEDEFDQIMVESSNVQAAVPTQSNANTNKEKSSNGWLSNLRPVGGFAVAASIGALAFMGLQNMGVLQAPNAQPDGIVNSSAPTAIVQATPSAEVNPALNLKQADLSEQYVEADAKTRSLLKRYVDSHMQYATTSTFVPSVRVIAFTDNQ